MLLAALAASLVSPTPSTTLSRLPTALARAVREYDEAQIKGDAAALNRLLAEAYVLVNSRAEVEDKRQMIADYVAPGFHLDPYVVEKPVVRRWAGGAIIGGEVVLSGTSEGAAFRSRLRFADVWRLRAGVWQVIFTEVTPVK